MDARTRSRKMRIREAMSNLDGGNPDLESAREKPKEARGGWLEEVPVPEIGTRDVLIKVLLTGLCGTDLHIYQWDEWAERTIPVPLVIGHEFVGEIVALGAQDAMRLRGLGTW